MILESNKTDHRPAESIAAGESRVPKLGIGMAFAAVFLIWGSVYLGIKFAIETLPPLLMVGTRLAVSGICLYGWARWRGAARPTPRHWLYAALIGMLVLAIGAGSVAWAQQRVPSGLTALLIATEPFWIVLLDWLWHGGPKPRAGMVSGIVLGLFGIVLLAAPRGMGMAGDSIDPLGCVTILTATIAWASGSLYSRRAPQPPSLILAAAMHMISGGGVLVLAGLLAGEWGRVDLASVTWKSWMAYAYLLIFASLITFPAYIWLLQKVRAARVAVYAYVNPVVAVFLGWAVGGESLDGRTLLAAVVIIGAVVLVVSFTTDPPPRGPSRKLGELESEGTIS